MSGQESDSKAKRHRSPKYPALSLKRALDRVKEFWEKEKRNEVALSVALKDWSYSQKSSGGLKAVAALKTFGLMDDTGAGKARRVRLTDKAIRYMLDTRENSPDREKIIKEAALTPKIYRVLLNKYPGDLPSDSEIRYYLTAERDFNEDIVDSLIKDFRDTIKYAKLKDSASIADNGEDIEDEQDDIKDDQGGGDLDDSKENQLLKHKKPPMKTGMQQATFPLDEGEVFFQWPESLSETSLEDLEAWLELVKRKIQRSVSKNPEQKEN